MSPEEDQVWKAIRRITDILEGTAEKIGLIHVVDSNSKWISKEKKKREGVINLIYKVIILFVLGYIAAKVGLK